jgi:hypothetical protein
MAVLIANNAKSTLAVAVGGLDTTITIASGTETLFPAPTGGDYFYVTLEDSTKTIREIVKCTARTGNVLTVVRAQDGTFTNIFSVGATVELRINRASLTDSIVAAANSASAAAASASSASTSATTATTQAGIATTQATTATTQAGIATTQATNAANSATAANNSALAAAASAASGLYSAVQDKSANYTVVVGDAGDLLRVTTTGGPVTITLPLISSLSDGFKLAVVKWTGDANIVTIARSGTNTINGATTATIGSQYTQITFVADFETNQWFAATSGLGSTNVVVDVFSGTGAQTVYTLSGDPGTKTNTHVYISGIYQQQSTYSTTGSSLTFSTAPPAGTSNIEIVWTQPLPVGVPSDTTVTTAKLVDGAVTSAKMANSGYEFGMRNRVINGDMRVSQRGTSFASGAVQYGLDRWQFYRAGAVAGATCIQTTTASAIAIGFNNYAQVQRNSGDTSTASLVLATSFETQNIRDLAGKTVTLSFYTFCSGAAVGNVVGNLVYGTGTDGSIGVGFTSGSIIGSVTSTSNNAWVRSSLTVTLPSNATQLAVQIAYNSPTGTAGAYDYFGVTGVQLEAGSTATPFEYRPYGTELALCQRYLPAFTAAQVGDPICPGWAFSATDIRGVFPFYVEPRVAPTGITATAASGFNFRGPGTAPTAISFSLGSKKAAEISLAVTGATLYAGTMLYASAVGAQILFTGCEL